MVSRYLLGVRTFSAVSLYSTFIPLGEILSFEFFCTRTFTNLSLSFLFIYTLYTLYKPMVSLLHISILLCHIPIMFIFIIFTQRTSNSTIFTFFQTKLFKVWFRDYTFPQQTTCHRKFRMP